MFIKWEKETETHVIPKFDYKKFKMYDKIESFTYYICGIYGFPEKDDIDMTVFYPEVTLHYIFNTKTKEARDMRSRIWNKN